MSFRVKVSLLSIVTVMALMWSSGFADMHEQAAIDAGAIVLTAPSSTTTTTTAPATTVATTTTTVLPIIYPPAPSGARCPPVWTLAQQAGWTYDELEAALDRIMWAESRCRPEVRSRTRDTGLTQINDIHLSMLEAAGISAEMLTDPLWNLVAARLVADQAESYGWKWTQPWAATYP